MRVIKNAFPVQERAVLMVRHRDMAAQPILEKIRHLDSDQPAAVSVRPRAPLNHFKRDLRMFFRFLRFVRFAWLFLTEETV